MQSSRSAQNLSVLWCKLPRRMEGGEPPLKKKAARPPAGRAAPGPNRTLTGG